jgi:hypothetical protein
MPEVVWLVAFGDRAGEAEVGDLDLPVVGEQHVLGLHVPVHDARLVCRAERGEHRLEHLESLARVEPADLAQQVAQGTARDVLHRQEHVTVVGALVVDPPRHWGARAARRTWPHG